MKHLFFINPTAGKRSARERLEADIRDLFGGLDYRITVTEYAGQAAQLARAAAETGEAVRLYACGGDGTLNEVVNGAAGFENAAVTHVPTGTGNDFLKVFGEGMARFHDLTALRDGPQTAFDVMDCNGRLGLDVVCAGVDARIAADVHRYKSLPLVTGMGAYAASLVVNVLFKGIARHMAVTVDGQTLDEEFSILCVCNGRHYGGGFMPVGEAMPDDGILDILLVTKVSRLTFFRLVGEYAKGHYRRFPSLIRHYHTDAIHFSDSEDIVAVVDGEVMKAPDFTVRLSEKKVNFFYPRGLDFSPAPEFSTQAVRL